MSKAEQVISDLVKTNFSKDNDSQAKALELMKGLAFSDEEISNKFFAHLEKAVNSFKTKDTTNEGYEFVDDVNVFLD